MLNHTGREHNFVSRGKTRDASKLGPVLSGLKIVLYVQYYVLRSNPLVERKSLR